MREQSHKEELYNAITHGIGFLLSLVGFALLLAFHKYDTTRGLIAVILYGVSLSLLYFVSSIYHYEKNDKRKQLFRKLDHISIYLLIAGTYSPIVLLVLEDSLGWLLFWVVWGIAILGTILKVFFTGRFEIVSLILYLFMGWLIVFDIQALLQKIDLTGIVLLAGGGVAYTVGIIFYVLDRVKYSHVIWHLFVLAGSVLHYLFIFLKVI
jgi:hemolysin III